MKFNLFKAKIIFLTFTAASCSTSKQKNRPSEYVLNNHRQFSRHTDPGKYAYLYNALPESLDDLCVLIKKQLIYPFDVGKFSNKIPRDRTLEDMEFPYVSQS